MPNFVFDSFTFDEPLATITACELHEVHDVLQFAERESLNGSYVAVMLSYEAAPAFESILAVHKLSHLPLAWAAAFSSTSKIQDQNDATRAPDSWTLLVERDEYDHA